MDSSEFNSTLNSLLRSLSYREREVFKLRTGVGDGFTYSFEEIARVFDVLPPQVEAWFESTRSFLGRELRELACSLMTPARWDATHAIEWLRDSISSAADLQAKPLGCLIRQLSQSESESSAQDYRATYLGWMSPDWSELVALEPQGNSQMHQVQFVVVGPTIVEAVEEPGFSPTGRGPEAVEEAGFPPTGRGPEAREEPGFSPTGRGPEALEVGLAGQLLAVAAKNSRMGLDTYRCLLWDPSASQTDQAHRPTVNYMEVQAEMDSESTNVWWEQHGYVENGGFCLLT